MGRWAGATSDEDKRAVVLTGATAALKQLNTFPAILTPYQSVLSTHAKTLMPWRSVKSDTARVKVKENIGKKRKVRRAREKNRTVRAKKDTAAEKVTRAVRAKIDALSAGKQATQPRNVG